MIALDSFKQAPFTRDLHGGKTHLLTIGGDTVLLVNGYIKKHET